MYQLTELSNKLRIISQELPDRDSAAIGIWIGVGGRYEDDANKGAAHFLEHIVFRGSAAYSCSEIKEKIEGVGGSLNAFTAEEQTCYYAKVPAKHLFTTFDILADMAFWPLIQKRDVERERMIILEEIKMYNDLPQYQVMDHLDEILWPDHPLGQNLAGTFESVGRMAVKDLKAFQKYFYAPNRVVISACGKVDHKALVRAVENKLAGLSGHCEAAYTPVQEFRSVPQLKVHSKKTEQMHLAMGLPAYAVKHEDLHILSILNVMLGGNMSSRLFDEVREKRGLAYSISSGAKALDDTGMFLIRAGVDNTKVVDALALILKILRSVRRSGFKEAEFNRAKEYYMGQFLLGLEDTLDHMIWIGESVMTRNRVRTLEEVVKKVRKVTLDDVQRVASDVFRLERLHVALIGPVEKSQQKEIQGLVGV